MPMTDSHPPIEILIAEDNSLYKKIIIDSLNEDPNFKVTGEAKDGKTAIRLSEELMPDIVIMDLGLPIMSGIEASKIIKISNPSIKIVALSSHINKSEAIEALAAGAICYISKDMNINQLKMILETIYNGAVWINPIIGQKILSEIIENYKR